MVQIFSKHISLCFITVLLCLFFLLFIFLLFKEKALCVSYFCIKYNCKALKVAKSAVSIPIVIIIIVYLYIFFFARWVGGERERGDRESYEKSFFENCTDVVQVFGKTALKVIKCTKFYSGNKHFYSTFFYQTRLSYSTAE